MKTCKIFVFIMLAAFSFASYTQAFTSIHPDFKRKFSPDKITGGKLSTLRSPVPSRFKAFVPPGATKATMIIYGPQGKVYGAVARVDNPPQCKYNLMSEQEAENLPWKKPNACTLNQMRKEDCQNNGVDGQIEVLSWGMSPLTGKGHWVYVIIENHARTQLAEVNFTVNVDRTAYSAWHKSVSWSGRQPPLVASGPTGGRCDPKWKKGGAAPGPKEGGFTPAQEQGGSCANQGEALGCTFKGGKWKPFPDCVCENTAAPEPHSPPPPPSPTVLDIALNPLTQPADASFSTEEKQLESSIETINVNGDFDIIFLWGGNEERAFTGKVLELIREGRYQIVAGKKGKFVGIKFKE